MLDNRLIELTADIVSAHVSSNTVATTDIPAFIQNVYAALSAAETPAAVEAPKQEPAVSIRSSIKPDYIVCLEDGAKLKMLKRYLRTKFDMSPEDYRAKWDLPRDYPMVAPTYTETRRTLAHAIGLGRKKVVDVAAPVAKAVKASARKAITSVEQQAPAKKRGRPAAGAAKA